MKVEELENSVLEAIKLHIELLIDTENILEQINKSETMHLANENISYIKQAKEKEIEKISNLKRGLYEDWKNEDITKDEYLEYKQKYEQDIERIKNIILNLNEQRQKEENIINEKSKWIENFKQYKNISELDRDIIIELIDYIEVYEKKKIKIHFKFTNEWDKISEYIKDSSFVVLGKSVSTRST